MNVKIIFVILLLIIFIWCFIGCTGVSKRNIISPNGKIILKFICKSKYGILLPGPEPPKIKSSKFFIDGFSNNKKVFSVDIKKDIYIHSNPFGICDLKWSRDSEFFALKIPNSILIYDKNGSEIYTYSSVESEKISSINWGVNSSQLIAVLKKNEHEKGLNYPFKSTGIKIIQIVPLSKDSRILFSKTTKPVNFIQSGFIAPVHEISPDSKYVVYPDGNDIIIFNLEERTIDHNLEKHGDLLGIWWINKKEVLLVFNDVSNDEWEESFFLYSMPKKTLEDVTVKLTKKNSQIYDENDGLPYYLKGVEFKGNEGK